MASIPNNYRRLEGSERLAAPNAKRLGPADDNEVFSVTIVLRRRPDGPPAPDHAHFLTTGPARRGRMPQDEFAAKYGAHPGELANVADFAKSQGLTVVETNAARRSVVVSGTVARMSKAFAIELGRYEHNVLVSAMTATTVTLNQPITADIPAGTQIYFNSDSETTQDICIASSAAPGAAIAVYFSTNTQQGWVDLIGRAVHPPAGDPNCSVLSSSFYVSDGDDLATLTNESVTTAWIDALSSAFQDAAIQDVTVCIASGDTGSDSKVGAGTANTVGDGNAHVQYPASDPWVLSIGGTTIGNVSGTSFDEYVWNDTFFATAVGATGGGISDYFVPNPSYQNSVGVPASLNDGHIGRGVPDVAANSSPNSGYPIIVNGSSAVGDGTSAAAPLWAALIAVINAALDESVGFVNPRLYELGSRAFQDIVGAPGPADNGLNGIAGYPAGPGWDACTGWGSPNGVALLNGLNPNPIARAIWLLAILVTPNPVPASPIQVPGVWVGSGAPSATQTQPLYGTIKLFVHAIFSASSDMAAVSADIKSALAEVAKVLSNMATTMPTSTPVTDINNAMAAVQNSLALAQSFAPGGAAAVLNSASGLFQQMQAQLTAIVNMATVIDLAVADMAQLSQLLTALADLFP
jgi:hypothetical protein